MNETIRSIDADERSGVLAPTNLARFAAQWEAPAAEVLVAVDTYWSVSWRLPAGEQIEQHIVDFPAITVSIEEGDVPAHFVVTTTRPKAWSRTIRGQGSVFAIRMRPAGLAVLSDLDPLLIEHEQEITRNLDGRLFELLRQIAEAPRSQRSHRADELIQQSIRERPPGRIQLLANDTVASLTATPEVRTGGAVAKELATSERTMQRALRSTIGLGPNEVARRIRLQEVVRRVSLPNARIVTVAAELGYADQAHLINEFRAVSGTTPGRYVRMLRDMEEQLASGRVREKTQLS